MLQRNKVYSGKPKLKKLGEVLQRIRSKDNKKIKYAAGLKQKSIRKQEASFLIEGKKMLGEALKYPGLLRQVFIEEEMIPEYEEIHLLNPGGEFYVVDKRLMRHISSTETPPGILAVCQVPPRPRENAFSENCFLLYLDRIADPGNLGTIIRNAWALGVDGILLSPGSVDPFSPKAVRASMGGIFNIPLFLDFTLGELKGLREEGFTLFCASLQAELEVFSIDFTGPSVLVIGNESKGVNPAVGEICDIDCKIPIRPEVDSLNAAVACAIIIFEAWKQRRGFILS